MRQSAWHGYQWCVRNGVRGIRQGLEELPGPRGPTVTERFVGTFCCPALPSLLLRLFSSPTRTEEKCEGREKEEEMQMAKETIAANNSFTP